MNAAQFSLWTVEGWTKGARGHSRGRPGRGVDPVWQSIDSDGDGLCAWTIAGVVDACGVCNGPGGSIAIVMGINSMLLPVAVHVPMRGRNVGLAFRADGRSVSGLGKHRRGCFEDQGALMQGLMHGVEGIRTTAEKAWTARRSVRCLPRCIRKWWRCMSMAWKPWAPCAQGYVVAWAKGRGHCPMGSSTVYGENGCGTLVMSMRSMPRRWRFMPRLGMRRCRRFTFGAWMRPNGRTVACLHVDALGAMLSASKAGLNALTVAAGNLVA